MTAHALPEAFRVEFSPPAAPSVMVVSPDPSYLVTVRTDAAPLGKAVRLDPKRGETELAFAGQDKVTRLSLFRNPGGSRSGSWVSTFSPQGPEDLRALSGGDPVPCRFEKWVTQVGDKVLPLGLVSVSFRGAIPAAGSPIVDGDGKIVALVFQPAGANMAYALPAQAVHRVMRDVVEEGRLVRAWLGISLSTESSVPRITRVLPESPAARAGFRADDVLIKVGAHTTERYPDAVNALFYVVPGQRTTITFSRNNQRMERELMPEAK